MSELSERLRQGRDQHPLHLSHDMGERAYAQMQERGVDLMSIYYFGIRVLVPLGWPYADGAEDIIYENFFEVVSLISCRYQKGLLILSRNPSGVKPARVF